MGKRDPHKGIPEIDDELGDKHLGCGDGKNCILGKNAEPGDLPGRRQIRQGDQNRFKNAQTLVNGADSETCGYEKITQRNREACFQTAEKIFSALLCLILILHG